MGGRGSRLIKCAGQMKYMYVGEEKGNYNQWGVESGLHPQTKSQFHATINQKQFLILR